MELIAEQMRAFMQAYIDCLNDMYNGANFVNTSEFGIITKYDIDMIPFRYVSITHDNKAYVRSDGAIFYQRQDLLFQEIPVSKKDSNLIVFDDWVLSLVPSLQIYQGIPVIDLINLCYKDVDTLIKSKHYTGILYSFEELYDAFLDFGFTENETPGYIYDIQLDAMEYSLSYYPVMSITGEHR